MVNLVRNVLLEGIGSILLNQVYYEFYIALWLIDAEPEVQKLFVNV